MIITMLTAVLFVLFFFNYVVDDEIYDDAVFLYDGWQVQVNDDISENVNLEEFSLPVAKRGDRVQYQRNMPAS